MGNIIQMMFLDTETLKTKTRGQIRLLLWPLKLLSIIVGPLLSLRVVIEQYGSIESDRIKFEVMGLAISIVIIISLFKRFTQWLNNWQTNKREKHLLRLTLKIMPLIVIVLGFQLVSQNLEIAEVVIKNVVVLYGFSFLIDYYAAPLSVELMTRDKLRLESTNRVLD
jgi:hypothetical protein